MDRLRALFSDASRYLAQLTRRERLMLGAAAATMVLFVGSLSVAAIRSSIARREDAISDKERSLEKVQVYAQSYAANEQRRRQVQSRLAGPPVALMTDLQKLAEQQGLAIASMNPRGDQTRGKVKESMVEVQIASTPLDKLTNLLNEVEKNPHVVRVEKLHVRRISGDDKSLNVSLTVATYSLVNGD